MEVTIKVINANCKVHYERKVRVISLDEIPYSEIVRSLSFLYRGLPWTVIFESEITPNEPKPFA